MTRRRRPPLLIALQAEATVLMSLAIGQAGLAAGFLTGTPGAKSVHAVNAWIVTAVSVALLMTAIAWQRVGGPRWPVLGAGIVVLVVIAQVVLGRLEVAGSHIFLGVLFVTMATLLTSYLFRPGFVPAEPG